MWSLTYLRVTQHSGLCIKSSLSTNLTIYSNEYRFLSLSILLRFWQPLYSFQLKKGQLVIMTSLFSRQGSDLSGVEITELLVSALWKMIIVYQNGLWLGKGTSWIFCAKCTTVLKCNTCHLKLNSSEDHGGREAWISPWESAGPRVTVTFICWGAHMPFCHMTLCALKLCKLCCCVFLVQCLTKLGGWGLGSVTALGLLPLLSEEPSSCSSCCHSRAWIFKI